MFDDETMRLLLSAERPMRTLDPEPAPRLSATPMVPEVPLRMGAPSAAGMDGEALDALARVVLQATRDFRPRTDFEGFVSGLAGGLAGVRDQSAGRREAFEASQRQRAGERDRANMAEQEAQRDAIRKNASGLASHRWASARAREEDERRAVRDREQREWEAKQKVLDRAAYGNPRGGGGKYGDGGGGGYEHAADMVESGTAKLTEFPYGARLPIVNILAERGSGVVPSKVRETIASMSAARGVIDELESMSRTVNKAKDGMGRFSQGVVSATKGVMQGRGDEDHALYDKTAEGFLATISRATGERGVLTDRDVFRAKQLLPSRYDTRAIAEQKIANLRSFIDSAEQRALRAYTTANPAAEPSAPRLDSPRQTQRPADDLNDPNNPNNPAFAKKARR